MNCKDNIFFDITAKNVAGDAAAVWRFQSMDMV